MKNNYIIPVIPTANSIKTGVTAEEAEILRFGAGRLDQRSGRNFELEMQSLRSFLLISIVTAKYHEEQL